MILKNLWKNKKMQNLLKLIKQVEIKNKKLKMMMKMK